MTKMAGIWLGGAVTSKKALGAVSHALLACSLLLTACMQKDPDPVGPDKSGTDFGKAEIHLPALPPGFLAKASASGGAADPFFILTISGSGMVTRKHAWPLSTAGGTAVTVENIPAGSRLFTGEIEAGGGIVYADSVWTDIRPGQTALVRLRLARTSGNAKVCVEIEGLPPPTGCGGRDSLPDVSGCWRAAGMTADSIEPPVLRIFQDDSLLQAVLSWPSAGWQDTARGGITNTGIVYLDGDFHFSGSLDPAAGSIPGKLLRRGAPVLPVMVTLLRAACGPVAPPVDSALTCYDVAQYLDKVSSRGRFAVWQQGPELYGHFQWQGYPGMSVNGKAGAVNGNLGLYLYGNLPAGLARDPLRSDGVHYKAQATAAGGLDFGAIYGTEGAYVLRGDWKGYAVPCQAPDREIIRRIFGI